MTKYYLTFTDYSGNTFGVNGGYLYEVSNVAFGATQTLNIGSQSSGAGAGKAVFTPLTFTTLSSALTVQFDAMLASGTPFAQVNLYGFDTTAGGAPVQVVHDVFKLAALKSDAINPGTGTHAVAFEYGGLVESSTPQNPDGSSGTAVTKGWDLVRNVSDTSLTTAPHYTGTVPLPATIDPRTNTAAAGSGGALHLYARFTDYSGTVLGGGWIALDSAGFGFDQTLDIGAQSSGAGAGKVTFDPLKLSFQAGTQEPTLLASLASGTPFKQLEIAAYTGSGTTSTLVDDYRLNLVALQASTHVVTDGTPVQTYTVQYGQEVVTHVTTASDGTTSSVTKGWDVVRNVSLSDALLPAVAPVTEAAITTAAIATGEGPPTRYYLTFTDYSGNTFGVNGGYLYEVSNVAFGATQTLNIGSQSSGAGAGKAVFTPLTFTTLSSALTVQFDAMLASGTPFAQVNLYGFDTTAGGAPVQVVHDVFKLAALKSDAINPGTGTHAVAFEYGGLVESSTPQNPDGSSGTAVTKGWDLVRNVSDTSLTTAPHYTGTVPLPATIDPRTNTAAAGSGGALHLYARFTDYSGTVLGGGWIALDSAGFGFDQTLDIGAQSSGAGAGKVTFDPLKLSFQAGTQEPTLLASLASGTPFKQLEIAAYTGSGTTSTLVDDYRLNLVALQASTHAVTDGTPVQTYTVQYGQEVVTHVTTASDGTTSSVTKGWDVVRNVSLSDALLPAVAPVTEAAITTAAIATGEGPPTRYYLTFTDYSGNTFGVNGGYLYEVSNVAFGATQTLNIGSQSSGAGAGKAVFTPLTFTTLSSALTVQFDAMLASGTPFAQVNLYGFDTTAGGAPVQVVHDVFKLAALKSDAINPGTGTHAVAFEYGGLVESSTPQNPDGSSGTAVTKGWDLVRNVSDTSLTTAPHYTGTVPLPATIDPRTNTAAAGSGGALHLYARFTDYSGTVLGGGWIALDSAGFGFDQTLDIGAQSSGAGAGKVTFDPLKLSFQAGTQEPTLLASLASGTPFKQLEIAAYTGSGTTSTLVDDYRLNLVALQASTHAVTDGTPVQTYTVQYGQEVVTHVTTASDGTTSSVTKGWDVVRNVSLSDALLPAVAPVTEAAITTAAIATGEGPPTAPSLQLAGVKIDTAGHPIVVVSGLGQRGATVTLYDGTAALASTIADVSTGAYKLGTSAGLGAGHHLLTATATDADGGHSDPSIASIDVQVGGAPGGAYAAAVTVHDATGEMTKQTQYYASGKVSSQATFNISGQTYTGTVYRFDPSGQLVSARYDGVTGQPYQSFETDYSFGDVVDNRYTYTGITGAAYTTVTSTVNTANQQTDASFGGVQGAPYSAFDYHYASGLFAGSTFTYTNVPAGATYSSYAVDYSFDSAYQGARFFYTNITGQSYGGEEVDTDPSGAATRVVLTGFSAPTSPYTSLELDYTAGVYTGYKTLSAGTAGQSYKMVEQDVSAANVLTKSVYSGLTGTPYSSLEQDFIDGAVSTNTFVFTGITGQPYTGYAVTQNAAGVQLSETVNNADGSHTILGSANNLIFEAIGNDTITGGGSGETFAFHTVFGHAILTDFHAHATGNGHDTIDLSTADFTSFAALASAAQTVSGGVMLTGKSGSSITLQGVDKATLAGLGADFKFHA